MLYHMPKRPRKPENPKLPPPGPVRPPRVTDDDDDGLAGAPVPKKPRPTLLSGAGAKPLPKGQSPPPDPAQSAMLLLTV